MKKFEMIWVACLISTLIALAGYLWLVVDEDDWRHIKDSDVIEISDKDLIPMQLALGQLDPKILSASQMRYFATQESFEKMSMYDLLSVYKTAGTASTDEFYALLLETLNDPKRHGSPLIHDYRYAIWLRSSTLTREWCPYAVD